MSRVFITGSSTGLGLMTGRLLAEQGHQVVLHARDERRAGDARAALSAAGCHYYWRCLTPEGSQRMAEQLNGMGRFDVLIHNVGVGYRESRRILTQDGLPHVFAINVIAPYVLTALLERPVRLVYLARMHQSQLGRSGPGLAAPPMRRASYTTCFWRSRLRDVGLTCSRMRLSRDGCPRRMGGSGAPDDINQAHLTQAWLAVSNEPAALVTGQYFYHMRPRQPNPQVYDTALQDGLVDACERLSGVKLRA